MRFALSSTPLSPPCCTLTEGGKLTDMTEYVRNNAGKAFEFMLEVVEEDRKAAGLPDIATARAEASEDPKVTQWKGGVLYLYERQWPPMVTPLW